METCNKVITTKKIEAGKRTYFIDHLETKNGSSYVKIKEFAIINENKSETHRLMIFEENLKALVDILRAMIPTESCTKQVA